MMNASTFHAAKAHSSVESMELERLQTLSLRERGELLEAACAAAMEIERCREAARMSPTGPAPWPQSTWDYLRKHAPTAEASSSLNTVARKLAVQLDDGRRAHHGGRGFQLANQYGVGRELGPLARFSQHGRQHGASLQRAGQFDETTLR